MPRPALPRCCHAACPPLQSSPDPRENRVGGWAKKCARCCGCGAPLRFRVVLRLCKRRETMKVMRVEVSLGECCCFSRSRTLPLSASPRLPSLRQHAPLGSPQAPTYCVSAIPVGFASARADRGDEGEAMRGQLGRVLLFQLPLSAPNRLAPPPQAPAPWRTRIYM